MATNDGRHVQAVRYGTMAEEMEALDALGPLTRASIYNSPIRISAAGILQQIREAEEKARSRAPESIRDRIKLDPKERNLDLSIAENIKRESMLTVRRDRSEADALLSVKPMVPHYSVKSLREQRRTARRVRW